MILPEACGSRCSPPELFWVVEAAGTVAGNATQQPAIIVVLPPQPLLVVIQFEWQIDLVTGTTELSRLVQRLEERLLVERRLGLHKLVVHPLQKLAVAFGKWIMNWLFNRVVRITLVAVDMRDGMANRT